MFRLKDRDAKAGIDFHVKTPARIYDVPGEIHSSRIKKSRDYVTDVAAEAHLNKHSVVYELCSGTSDIGGPFSTSMNVIAVDCNPEALQIARQRFPLLVTMEQPLEELAAKPCDLVILCECLEHLADPLDVVLRWLEKAKYAVISHPIDEPMGSELSAGEHCWSFNPDDFFLWFKLGGHEIIKQETMQLGCYTIAIAASRKN